MPGFVGFCLYKLLFAAEWVHLWMFWGFDSYQQIQGMLFFMFDRISNGNFGIIYSRTHPASPPPFSLQPPVQILILRSSLGVISCQSCPLKVHFALINWFLIDRCLPLPLFGMEIRNKLKALSFSSKLSSLNERDKLSFFWLIHNALRFLFP